MEELKSKIISILKEIDEEIVDFEGENLVDEGLIDSFTIVLIMTQVEEKLNISISPEDVMENNFKSLDSILNLVIRSKK